MHFLEGHFVIPPYLAVCGGFVLIGHLAIVNTYNHVSWLGCGGKINCRSIDDCWGGTLYKSCIILQSGRWAKLACKVTRPSGIGIRASSRAHTLQACAMCRGGGVKCGQSPSGKNAKLHVFTSLVILGSGLGINI